MRRTWASEKVETFVLRHVLTIDFFSENGHLVQLHRLCVVHIAPGELWVRVD